MTQPGEVGGQGSGPALGIAGPCADLRPVQRRRAGLAGPVVADVAVQWRCDGQRPAAPATVRQRFRIIVADRPEPCRHPRRTHWRCSRRCRRRRRYRRRIVQSQQASQVAGQEGRQVQNDGPWTKQPLVKKLLASLSLLYSGSQSFPVPNE